VHRTSYNFFVLLSNLPTMCKGEIHVTNSPGKTSTMMSLSLNCFILLWTRSLRWCGVLCGGCWMGRMFGSVSIFTFTFFILPILFTKAFGNLRFICSRNVATILMLSCIVIIPSATAAVYPKRLSASPSRTRNRARCILSLNSSMVMNSPLIGTGSFALKPNASTYDFVRLGRFSMLLYAFFEIMFNVVPVSTMCLSDVSLIFKSMVGHVNFRPVSLLITYFNSLRAYLRIISAALIIVLPCRHSLSCLLAFDERRLILSSGDDCSLSDVD
jgi:hypothetical protein